MRIPDLTADLAALLLVSLLAWAAIIYGIIRVVEALR